MENEDTKKSQILNIAIKQFATKGYDGVGIQEICQLSGITKPTLYYYFGSKSGILENITATYGITLCDAINKSAEYEHDFQKSITKLYRTMIQFALDNPDFFSLHYVLSSAPENSEANNIYSKVKYTLRKTILDFFKSSTQELGNMRGKEDLYSLIFLNNLNSAALMAIHNEIELKDETVSNLVHSFMYGIVN